MAKEDNLFEEKAEGTKPAVNADKLDREELWKRLYHETGR